MAWRVKWLSSFNNDFNHDYQVIFTPEEQASGQAYYNYTNGPSRGRRRPASASRSPDLSRDGEYSRSGADRGLTPPDLVP